MNPLSSSLPIDPPTLFLFKPRACDASFEIAKLEEETSGNPNNHEFWIQYATTLFTARRFELAINAFHQAQQISRLTVESTLLLATCYASKGHTTEAGDLYIAAANNPTILPLQSLTAAASLNSLDQSGMALVFAKRLLRHFSETSHTPLIGQIATDAAYYSARCAMPITSIEKFSRIASRSINRRAINTIHASICMLMNQGIQLVPEEWFQSVRTQSLIHTAT